jgi:hypothetical protein
MPTRDSTDVGPKNLQSVAYLEQADALPSTSSAAKMIGVRGENNNER